MFSTKPVAWQSSDLDEGQEEHSLPPSSMPPGLAQDPNKIKTLPPSVVKDIEQKNVARRLAGLSPIVIKVRRCIACGSKFESAGNRTCGCSSRTAGTIAGREII